MTAALQAAARTGYRAKIDGLRALAIAPVVVHNADVICPLSYSAELAEGRTVSAKLQDFAARDPRSTYVDAATPLCPGGRCRLIHNGQLSFLDGSQMTLAAARRVVTRIDPATVTRCRPLAVSKHGLRRSAPRGGAQQRKPETADPQRSPLAIRAVPD